MADKPAKKQHGKKKKSVKTICETSTTPFDMYIGKEKRVQVTKWRNENRVDIRCWEKGFCSPYPTKKGVSLTVKQYKTLCEGLPELEKARREGRPLEIRLGKTIYVTLNEYGVNIRKHFIPKQNPLLLLPSRYGIYLSWEEWARLVVNIPAITNASPEYNETYTCANDPTHTDSAVAMMCPECNVFPINVTDLYNAETQIFIPMDDANKENQQLIEQSS